MKWAAAWGRCVGVLCVAIGTLAGCGGGGGVGTGALPDSARRPLPQVVQDTEPAGGRIDVSADDFFVFTAGDRAQYWASARLGGLVEVQREVVAGPDADGRVSVLETVPANPGIGGGIEKWQRRAAGLFAIDYLGDGAPPGFKALVGDLLLYPTPFYAAGSTRTLVRQGGLGTDLDGDSHPESFRLEFRQVFVGFESGTRGGRQEKRARFRNNTTLVIEPSRGDVPVLTSEFTEEVVFAAHTGVISSLRTEIISGSNYADYNGLELLVGGTLAGRDVATAWNAGTTRYVTLRHYDLVYEPVTRYYYAGVSERDGQAPSTVARIEATSGALLFSEPLGGDVRSIAVSADGSTLYAGVYGRAEIVRLSLPDLVVRQRIPIAPGTWAFGLTVSPLDAGTLAYYGDNFGGLRLVRAGVVQPRAPADSEARADFTNDPMLFSADGAHLFLFGQTTGGGGSGLLRTDVLGDGIGGPVVRAPGTVFGRSLARSNAGLVAGNGLYAPDGLTRLRVAADSSLDSCLPLRDVARWACKTSSVNGFRVGVLDANTFALVDDGYIPLAPPPPPVLYGPNLVRVVPGPRGQVAVMVGGEAGWYGDWVALFDNPDFR